MVFVSFWFYPLVAAVLLVAALSAGTDMPGLLASLLYISAGLLGWTLLEYVLHRVVFHSHSRNRFLKELREDLHLKHHARPRDLKHLLVRLRFSLPISAVLFLVFFLATDSPASSALLLTGLWIGFLYYESVHYRLHMSSVQGRVLNFQRKQHFHHHFVNGHRCFGVTSPAWDIVFRTNRK